MGVTFGASFGSCVAGLDAAQRDRLRLGTVAVAADDPGRRRLRHGLRRRHLERAARVAYALGWTPLGAG